MKILECIKLVYSALFYNNKKQVQHNKESFNFKIYEKSTGANKGCTKNITDENTPYLQLLFFFFDKRNKFD